MLNSQASLDKCPRYFLLTISIMIIIMIVLIYIPYAHINIVLLLYPVCVYPASCQFDYSAFSILTEDLGYL